MDASAAAPQDAQAREPGAERLQRLLGEVAGFVDWLRDEHFGPVGAGDTADEAATAAESGLSSSGLLHTLRLMLARVLDDPQSLSQHYARFAALVLQAARQESELEPDPADRRFKDPLWRTSPVHRMLVQVYLAWQQTLGAWAAGQHFGCEDRKRVQFVLDQLVAALAPSNLPLNPAALKRAEVTVGASAVQGLKAWAHDAVHHGGMPQQIRPDAFKVGIDLATTPGAVVYRHPLFELLQYAPAAATVHRRPLLMVPPQINKFYVFDLRPENSVFGWLLAQGFQVFTISWRNPDAALRDAGLTAYVQATLQAVEVVRSITRSATLGLISACAGGLTAIAAMGLLAMQRQRPVAHHSMLVTAPLAGNGSVLESLASRDTMRASVAWSAQRGSMDGAELARLFAWLRPNDLVWNYWVNNYLMGRQPPPLDVLHWDNDSTRLPAALHRDFVDMVDRRVFECPGALSIGGCAIDFRRLQVDGYFVAGSEDYLMPWQGVYRAARHFRGSHSFVLSNSGHVQSILRPPRLPRTEHFTGQALPPAPEAWLAGAERRSGSWWPHWGAWLAPRSGARVKAPRMLGSAAYPPLGPAPGDYVLQA
ncbi:Poly(3-hydroxyalkanoate) polymerase 2 [Rubrivivax sp. A210]|uniref:class II poly(R)-hydroxyalkanoic acid synthase n=1 Tax=Rubrivivax sp. A210 TaxID=2772301 RepID=UPI00191A4AFC|nr:class II poly(R)-hydroxyalkanoic acid synthase [Rubrivivax sp. A210]CAD5371605.1 Poly(3-hydroxyalkanoate) polymerase 2 [Rubrivivax sp. A210]